MIEYAERALRNRTKWKGFFQKIKQFLNLHSNNFDILFFLLEKYGNIHQISGIVDGRE